MHGDLEHRYVLIEAVSGGQVSQGRYHRIISIPVLTFTLYYQQVLASPRDRPQRRVGYAGESKFGRKLEVQPLLSTVQFPSARHPPYLTLSFLLIYPHCLA